MSSRATSRCPTCRAYSCSRWNMTRSRVGGSAPSQRSPGRPTSRSSCARTTDEVTDPCARSARTRSAESSVSETCQRPSWESPRAARPVRLRTPKRASAARRASGASRARGPPSPRAAHSVGADRPRAPGPCSPRASGSSRGSPGGPRRGEQAGRSAPGTAGSPGTGYEIFGVPATSRRCSSTVRRCNRTRPTSGCSTAARPGRSLLPSP